MKASELKHGQEFMCYTKQGYVHGFRVISPSGNPKEVAYIDIYSPTAYSFILNETEVSTGA